MLLFTGTIVVIVYWYHCCVPLCAGIAPVVTTAKEAIQHSGSEIAQATFTRSGEKVCIICSSSVYLSVCTIHLALSSGSLCRILKAGAIKILQRELGTRLNHTIKVLAVNSDYASSKLLWFGLSLSLQLVAKVHEVHSILDAHYHPPPPPTPPPPPPEEGNSECG